MNIVEHLGQLGLSPDKIDSTVPVLIVGPAVDLPWKSVRMYNVDFEGTKIELPKAGLDLMVPTNTFSLVIVTKLPEGDIPVDPRYWGTNTLPLADVVVRLATQSVASAGALLLPEGVGLQPDADESLRFWAPGVVARERVRMLPSTKDFAGFGLRPVSVKMRKLPGRVQAADDILMPTLRQGSNFIQLRLPRGEDATEWLLGQLLAAGKTRQYTEMLRNFQERLREDVVVKEAQTRSEQHLMDYLGVASLNVEESVERRIRKRYNQMNREALAYPERTSFENRYHVFGRGTRFRQGTKLYEVDHHFVERGSNKPPKLVLEELEMPSA